MNGTLGKLERVRRALLTGFVCACLMSVPAVLCFRQASMLSARLERVIIANRLLLSEQVPTSFVTLFAIGGCVTLLVALLGGIVLGVRYCKATYGSFGDKEHGVNARESLFLIFPLVSVLAGFALTFLLYGEIPGSSSVATLLQVNRRVVFKEILSQPWERLYEPDSGPYDINKHLIPKPCTLSRQCIILWYPDKGPVEIGYPNQPISQCPTNPTQVRMVVVVKGRWETLGRLYGGGIPSGASIPREQQIAMIRFVLWPSRKEVWSDLLNGPKAPTKVSVGAHQSTEGLGKGAEVSLHELQEWLTPYLDRHQ